MSATETTIEPEPAAGAGCGLLIARVARMSGYGLGRSLDRGRHDAAHEFAILHRLEQGGSAHGRELSRTLRLHPSNLVALLDQLEVGRPDRRAAATRATAAVRSSS